MYYPQNLVYLISLILVGYLWGFALAIDLFLRFFNTPFSILLLTQKRFVKERIMKVLTKLVRLLACALFILTLSACFTQPDANPPTNPPTTPPEASPEKHETIDGTPTITLSDGTFVVLERLDLVDDLVKQFSEGFEDEPQGFESLSLSTQQLPSRVDLSALQTAIKDQAGRGTCVAFTTAAAIEAAYKRERDVTLDLSEQYANHIQKMTWLSESPKAVNERETQLGAWGGSGVGYQLGTLFRLRFGLPTEASMAGIVASDPSMTYIPWPSYSNTNQEGDSPRFNWQDENLKQKDLDTWNLSSSAVSYSIPASQTLTNFPRDVLSEANYGVSRVRRVERSLNAMKTELAAEREIAFGISLTRPNSCLDDSDAPLPRTDACYEVRTAEIAEQYRGGVWRPLNEAAGGHAMLMVGYDDTKQVFIVKNSWGRDAAGKGRPSQADANADGFIEMSYDWMPKIYEVYSILETRDPSSWTNNQSFLGKWMIEADSSLERADLAAYHLPGAFPNSSLSGETDRRIGTLYKDDTIQRVNGRVLGGQMSAFFGSESINTSYDSVNTGTNINAYKVDDETLAGWISPVGTEPNNQKPFFASVKGYPDMQAARLDPVTTIAPLDFFGQWAIKGAGLDGQIEFSSSIPSGATGTYTAVDGTETTGVTLNINPRFQFAPDEPCGVRISVPLATPVTLDGKLFCNTTTVAKRALITGTPLSQGFYAYRMNLPKSIRISSPVEDSSVPRGSRSVTFSVETQGFQVAPSVTWASDVDGLLGESTTSISKFDLSFGTHIITAETTLESGIKIGDRVSFTITNDAPSVEIIEPTSAGPFCEGEDIRFRADGRDLNNWPSYDLPDSAFSWSIAGGSELGTGKSITETLPEGGYTISVRATDDQAAFAEASINLTVEICTDTPPTVEIIDPATDSGANDDEFAYDGFDDAKDMWYTDVILSGTASDAEDGDLSGSSLVWTTNQTSLQDAMLGTGSKITVRLYSNSCFGTEHAISLTATDSDGNVRTVIRRINIWTLC